MFCEVITEKIVAQYRIMDIKQVKDNLPSTPAFVLDKEQLLSNLSVLKTIKMQSGCRILYSIKALPLAWVMNMTNDYLDGFSVSSLFEAYLAREMAKDKDAIHITTPGLRDDDYPELFRCCSHISFNSITQYQRAQHVQNISCSLGFRINPQSAFADDVRYDPCRLHSKLGLAIPFTGVVPKNIEGCHFHNVFSQTDYHSLQATITHINSIDNFSLADFKWLNLGGGYLHNQIDNHQPLIELIKQLTTDYTLDIFIEPGKAVVGDVGFIVTTVIDCFASDEKQLCVLDTSINHNPEVFEYQKKPTLLEHDNKGNYSCLLVGSTCLAGDLFGDYTFLTMPKIGDRLMFANVGAYSLVKANRFNGYNFPDIYSVDQQDAIECIKNSTYKHFREQWVDNESDFGARRRNS